MLYGDFVLDISFLQTILFALFAILTLFRDDYLEYVPKPKEEIAPLIRYLY
ncbi:Uncharacterized protein XB16_1435 [Leptospira santarosai]|uniref:Uncharacterized protein n=1 Tax=Leptospira santarosai TaxID=28183 RepID=A0A2P1QSR3_9LEPT|nr:Uncharacterized protein XB16_1435 [Leptospira santarosai]